MKGSHGLYVTHTALELFLGAIKLRGHYAHEVHDTQKSIHNKPQAAKAYTRHHAVALLALAYLGYVALKNDIVDQPIGRDLSKVLGLFHAGVTLVFAHACYLGAMPRAKVIVPHLPWAVGFAWHAFR